MAFNITDLSPVAPDQTYWDEFVTKVFFGFKSATVLQAYPGLTRPIAVPVGAASGDILTDTTCDFTPSGDVDVTPRNIPADDVSVQWEFCKKDIQGTFMSWYLRQDTNLEIEAALTTWLQMMLEARAQRQMEQLAWQGDDTLTNFLKLTDGFLKRFRADADVNDITAPVILTAGNIETELKRFYEFVLATLPDEVANIVDETQPGEVYMGGFALLMNPADWMLYTSQLTDGSFIRDSATGKVPLQYKSLPVITLPGIPTSKIVAADTSQLWYGFNNIEGSTVWIDLQNTTGDAKMRIRQDMNFGVNYAFGDRICFYDGV